MRVLHVYRSYFPDPPGGLQEAIRQICLATQPLGIDNRIFTLSPSPNPRRVKCPEAIVERRRSWLELASCDFGGPEAFAAFGAAAREADLVHYYFPWPFADLLHLTEHKKPSLLTYISDIVRQKGLSQLYAPLMWRHLRSMDKIVYNAPNYAESSPILSHPSLKPRLQQISLGMAPDLLQTAPDPAILERLQLETGKPFALFVGVLRYYKGLHSLIEAAAALPYPIVIAGDGPKAGDLRSQAAVRGLGNVMFTGAISEAEKVALLRACRVFVLPSHLRSEAFGMVLIEAAMHAKPLISCEIGTGTSYINADGETGFVLPPEDAPVLAEALNRLLGDEALANRLGQAAYQRYARLFDGRTMGQAYADLYRRVLGART